MKKIPLLPYYFRWIGLFVALITFIISQCDVDLRFNTFALLSKEGYFKFIFKDMQLTIVLFGPALGLMMMAFAKYKYEDEMISSIRLFSWSWSIIVSFLLYLFVTLLVYDSDFLMILYFPHFILLFFLVLFNFQLYILNRRLSHEG